MAQGLAGSFDAAFADLQSAPAQVLATTTPDLWAVLAEMGPDSAVITHAILPAPPAPSAAEQTRLQLAKRLTDLGFGAAAQIWIGSDGDPLALAAAELAAGQARAALTRLAGRPGAGAAALRARALLALGSVMLVMLALMGWALRVTARRRLRVLRDMQLQLSERGGSNLEPLDLDAMPRELWRLGRGINHLMQRLSHALQVERSMAANAAHELRTPLAVATLRLQTALDRGVDNTDVRAAYEAQVFPALEAYRPEFILISAGFDAHEDDPLAGLRWQAADYAWLTGRICDIADAHAGGRVVSTLEGGYDLSALQASVAAHVGVLKERSR